MREGERERVSESERSCAVSFVLAYKIIYKSKTAVGGTRVFGFVDGQASSYGTMRSVNKQTPCSPLPTTTSAESTIELIGDRPGLTSTHTHTPTQRGHMHTLIYNMRTICRNVCYATICNPFVIYTQPVPTICGYNVLPSSCPLCCYRHRPASLPLLTHTHSFTQLHN